MYPFWFNPYSSFYFPQTIHYQIYPNSAIQLNNGINSMPFQLTDNHFNPLPLPQINPNIIEVIEDSENNQLQAKQKELQTKNIIKKIIKKKSSLHGKKKMLQLIQEKCDGQKGEMISIKNTRSKLKRLRKRNGTYSSSLNKEEAVEKVKVIIQNKKKIFKTAHLTNKKPTEGKKKPIQGKKKLKVYEYSFEENIKQIVKVPRHTNSYLLINEIILLKKKDLLSRKVESWQTKVLIPENHFDN